MVKVSQKTTVWPFYEIPADSACLFQVAAGVDHFHALTVMQCLEAWAIRQFGAGVGERELTEDDLYVIEFVMETVRAVRKSLGVEV